MKEGWTYKKLGEVCEYAKTRINSRDISIENYIGVDNLLQNCQGRSLASKIPDELGLSEYWEGDVLVGNIRPYLKKIWLADCRGGCNGDVLAIRRKHEYTSIIDTSFLFKCLSTNYFFDFAMQYAKGEKMPRGDKKEILKYLIPIPPIAEQERIVAELDLLSGIIEKKKEQLKAYDQLAQSIFYTMFGDPIDNPKGWEVKKLGRVCTFTQGIQVPVEEQHKVKREGDIQFLRIIDFTQGKEEPRYVTNKNDKYVLHEREIAIVRYGTPGFICYGKNGAIANNLFKIKPNQNDMFDFYFMLYWLRSDAFQASVKNKQYGAALQAIKFNTIQGIGIILPPLSLQEEFAEKVEAIERQKALIQQSIEETQTMFDCTMDKYFG